MIDIILDYKLYLICTFEIYTLGNLKWNKIIT